MGRRLVPSRSTRVAYEPGTIVAQCANGGPRHELHTAGAPAKIVLSADRSTTGTTWEDVVYVTAQIVDEHGVVVPSATPNVTFAATGPAEIIATDSGENASHEAFQSSIRSAWQGLCLAMLRASASGRITVSAAAQGLTSGSVGITAR
jgi:beta-galactosidase